MIQNVRQMIVNRAKERGLDAAGLSRLVAGKVHRLTIYHLLNDGSDISTRTLGPILDALGLKVVASDSSRTPKRAAKPKAAGRRRKQT